MKDSRTVLISIIPSTGIHPERLAYIIDYLNKSPLLNIHCQFQVNARGPDIRIGYGEIIQQIESTIPTYHIPAQHILLAVPLKIITLKSLQANTYHFENKKLFSVETEDKPIQAFVEDKSFGFDLFEMMFFHLTRYEEAFAKPEQRDKHGYLREEYHFLYRNKLSRIPVVDHLLYCLLSVLHVSSERISSEIKITHDLDAIEKFPSVRKFIRGAGKLLFKDLKPMLLPRYIRQYFMTRRNIRSDPYDTFDWFLLNNNIKKHLFVLAGGYSKYEGFYDLNSQRVQEIIDQAINLGYIIGLHPSYHAIDDDQLLLNQKNNLEDLLQTSVAESRQHFLRFDILETPLQLMRCGIKIDHSMGYQNIIGFRAGTGFPYYWYSLKEEKTLSLVEYPFVVMDTALVAEFKGSEEEMQKEIKNLVSTEYWNTILTFNFHNSSFDELKTGSKSMKAVYELIVKETD